MITTNTLNIWAESWARFMWRSLIEVTVILIVVAILWLLIHKKASAQLGYGLFLLVLLKLMVPIEITVPSWLAFLSPGHSATRAVSRATLELPVQSHTRVSDTSFNSSGINHQAAVLSEHQKPDFLGKDSNRVLSPSLSFPAKLMVAWAAIVLLLLSWFSIVQLRTRRLFRQSTALDPGSLPVDFYQLKRLARVRKPVFLMANPRIPLPAAWGILRSRLVVPNDIDSSISPNEVKWILLHELAHIRRNDLAVALFQRLYQIVFFFNPSVWIANWVIDQLREYASDDLALATCQAPRSDCGRGFLSVIQRVRSLPTILTAPLGVLNYNTVVKRRMVRILDTKRKLHAGLSVGASASLLLAALILLPSFQAAEDLGAQSISAEGAKLKLSELTKGQSNAEERADTLTFRKVWETKYNDPMGNPSPDGRYILCYGEGDGNLGVCELATGQIRTITSGASWDGPFVMSPSFSPDGKEIAYAWMNKDGKTDLWIINTDGSDNRMLLKSENGRSFFPGEWSQDGSQILVYSTTLGTKSEQEIATVSPETGRLTTIKKAADLGTTCLSPDGKYVAFNKDGDIFLLPSWGGAELPLVSYPGNDRLLAWASDGKSVLFWCDRKGGGEIWAVSVENGKPVGEPHLIKHEVGSISSLGFSKNGSFFFKKGGWEYDIYEAQIDLTEKKNVGPQKPALYHNMGNNICAGWSDDGKSLGYVRFRESMGLSAVLCILDEISGRERVLEPNLLSFHELYWSPDAKAIAVYGRDPANRPGYFVINTQSGAVEPIFLYEDLPHDGRFEFCSWSSDGKSVFYLCKNSAGNWEIRKREIETGKEKFVYRMARKNTGIRNPAYSPDRQKLAFIETGEENGSQRILVLKIGEEEATEVFRVIAPIETGGLVWAPNGRSLLFTQISEKDRQAPSELWIIGIETKTPEKIGVLNKIAPDFFTNPQIHPDGKRIICTYADKNQEVWVMENFLPSLKGKNEGS